MEIYKRRIDPRLEKYGLANVGASGYDIGYHWHEPAETVSSTIEVATLSTYRVNNEYSVLYLPTVKGTYDIRTEHVKGFELKIEAQPFNVSDGQCIVMPTQGDSSKGLTDKCVCLRCIREVIRGTRRNTKDPISEVLRELSKPIRYRSITDKYPVVSQV